MNFQEDIEYQLVVNTENYYDSVHRFERPSDSRKFSDAIKDINRLKSKYRLLGKDLPFKLSMMYQTLSDPYKECLNNRKVLIVLVQQGMNYNAAGKTITIKIPNIVDFIAPNAIGEMYDSSNSLRRATYAGQNLQTTSISRGYIECNKLVIIGNDRDILGGIEKIEGYNLINPETLTLKDTGKFQGLSKIEFINFDASRMTYFQGDFKSEKLRNNVNLSDINLRRVQNTYNFEYYKQADSKLDLQKISFDGVVDLSNMYNASINKTSEIEEIDLSMFSGCKIRNMGGTFWYSSALRITGQEHIQFRETGVYGGQMFFCASCLTELPEFVFRIRIIDPNEAFYECKSLSIQSKDISQLQLCGNFHECFRYCNLPKDLMIDLSTDDSSGLNRFKFVNSPELGKLRVIEASNFSKVFFGCECVEHVTIQNALIVFTDTADIVYRRKIKERNRTGYDSVRSFDELSLESMFYRCKNLKQVTFRNIKIVNYYGDRQVLIDMKDMFRDQGIEEITFENVDVRDCVLSMDGMTLQTTSLRQLNMKNVQIGLLNQLDYSVSLNDTLNSITKFNFENVQLIGENANSLTDILGNKMPEFNIPMIDFNLYLFQVCNSLLVYILGVLSSITPSKGLDDEDIVRFYNHLKYVFETLKFRCDVDVVELSKTGMFMAEVTFQTHDGQYKYSRQAAVSRKGDKNLLEQGVASGLYRWYSAYREIYETGGDLTKIRDLLTDISHVQINLYEC